MAKKYKSPILGELLNEITPLEKFKVRSKMELAARIADLIQERGTQTQFAEKVGKHSSEISKWLSGVHNLTTDTLLEIAFALDLSLAELVEEKQAKQMIIRKSHFIVTGQSLSPKEYNPIAEKGLEDLYIPYSHLGTNLSVSTKLE